MPPTTHRALLALDAAGAPRVLATDSPAVASDVEEVSSHAEDIGICRARELGPGLWLWEGEIHVVNVAGPLDPAEWCPEYRGALRAVHDPVEVAELFTMHCPEPPECDDRESPGA